MFNITGKDVDNFLRLKKRIAEQAKKLEAMKSEASEMQDELIKNFGTGTKRVDGKIGSVTLKTTIEGAVKDWGKLYNHIEKTKDFSLLQKRLGQASYREQVEDGVRIPGVEKFNKKSLSIGYKRGA